ncbi:MAG: flagellar basal-body rod protein FlgG [Lachnospiraceae bacterium]|nr:flagellar basal-body rod protein FlgG [Lachnospiraceae bacterium]
MIRSLWTAASGMKSQQTNVDTISNNLANASTTGYKKETAEFKSLLYQTLQDETTITDGTAKPISAQVGLGVRNSAIISRFTQGTLQTTENPLDVAITGDGFFSVQLPDGTVGYTRNGSFSVAMIPNNDYYTIATSEGYPLLDSNGVPIRISKDYDASRLVINEDATMLYSDPLGDTIPLNITLGIYQFTNPSGLTKTSDSIMVQSVASGAPINEATANNIAKSGLKQGVLEGSNVQAVDEMVNLIVAQRAYEMNSKIITASDEMLQQANNLRA